MPLYMKPGEKFTGVKIMLSKSEADRKYSDLAKAHKIAAQIAALDKMDDIEQFGPIILKIMAGVSSDVWIILDEKPGLFGYMSDRFYMLRRVRNDLQWGSKLFAGLR
jgi:hypothetical protein